MTTPPTPAEVPGKIAGGAKAGGKGLAKSLKGHPPWLYAVVIVGAIAVAYMIRQRSNANAAAAMASSPDDTSTPYGGYGDTANYPGSTQGAFLGGSVPGDETTGGLGWDPATVADAVTQGIMAGIAGIVPIIGGGGMPANDPNAHTVPDLPIPAPYVDPSPAPPPIVHATPPPPPPPTATASAPQPTLGPGIFYNEDRKLRYVVQNKKTNTYPKGHNFRGYESRLNKGDWGQGGWIPV